MADPHGRAGPPKMADPHGRAGPSEMADLCGDPRKPVGPCSGAAFTETRRSQNKTDQLSHRTRTTELAQLKRDVQNFPFPLSSTTLDPNTNMSTFTLREIPMRGAQGGAGFADVPLNSIEGREFKREMSHILEDPLGLAE